MLKQAWALKLGLNFSWAAPRIKSLSQIAHSWKNVISFGLEFLLSVEMFWFWGQVNVHFSRIQSVPWQRNNYWVICVVVSIENVQLKVGKEIENNCKLQDNSFPLNPSFSYRPKTVFKSQTNCWGVNSDNLYYEHLLLNRVNQNSTNTCWFAFVFHTRPKHEENLCYCKLLLNKIYVYTYFHFKSESFNRWLYCELIE